jgi:hypothetical protein
MPSPFHAIVVCIILTLPGLISAQDPDQIIYNLIEETQQENDEEENMQFLIDDLNDLMKDPVNLNTATEEDFRRIFFLNDFQIKSIINYREESGEFVSVNELQLVTDIQPELFQKIQSLVTCSDKPMEKEYSYSSRIRSDLFIRYKKRLESPSGFFDERDSVSRFLGENRYLMTRYEIKTGSKISAGILTEQDAGEPYFLNKKLNPDHVTGYCEYQFQRKPIRVIIGDFRAGFGQGLSSGNLFMGKPGNGIIIPSRNRIIRSISTAESGFRRGLAFQLKQGDFTLSAFYSRVKMDATLKTNELSEYFTSINRSGLHRNIAEISKKKMLNQSNTGADLSFQHKYFTAGVFGERISYNKAMEIRDSELQNSSPQYLNVFHNLSLHYKFSFSKFFAYGEIASDAKNRLAIINGLNAQIHPKIMFCMLHRKYSQHSYAMNASAFGKTSGVKNEEGLYLALDINPVSFLQMSCYADHYVFPYPKTGMNAPSSGNDYMLNAIISHGREYKFTVRYKYSHQEKNTDRSESGINMNQSVIQRSLRLVSQYMLFNAISLETRFEQNQQFKPTQLNTSASYLGQKIIIRDIKKTSVYFSYGIFDIPDWENRIYLYENDILYDFSFLALYRKGSRFSFLIKKEIINQVDVWFKYYLTSYPIVVERGSGVDRIISNSDSGIKFQIRYSF